MFSSGFTYSVSYFFLLYRPPSCSLCTVSDSISTNIDEVLSINPSAVFVFGDFNVHHKDWLTHSSGTDRSGELCYNFSISNDRTQMVNFPTRIPDCDSHSPALLDLFLFFDASICSTMAFPPLGNSDHAVASFFIDFPSNSKWDAPFHYIAYEYSRADWDGHRDHFRDVPWRISLNSVVLPLLVNFVSGFWLELMYISFLVTIRASLTHLHGFQLFVLLPIVHGNHFFRLYRQNKSSESNVNFRQTSNRCKMVLEAAKLAYANKTKEPITS